MDYRWVIGSMRAGLDMLDKEIDANNKTEATKTAEVLAFMAHRLAESFKSEGVQDRRNDP